MSRSTRDAVPLGTSDAFETAEPRQTNVPNLSLPAVLKSCGLSVCSRECFLLSWYQARQGTGRGTMPSSLQGKNKIKTKQRGRAVLRQQMSALTHPGTHTQRERKRERSETVHRAKRSRISRLRTVESIAKNDKYQLCLHLVVSDTGNWDWCAGSFASRLVSIGPLLKDAYPRCACIVVL